MDYAKGHASHQNQQGQRRQLIPRSQTSWPARALFEVRQSLLNRRWQLPHDNTIIVFRFVIFKPRNGLETWELLQIDVGKLGNPRFFFFHGSTIERASLSNAKMLIVASSEAVVEVAIRASEGCVAWRVVVHADDVDIVGSRPPGLDIFDSVVIRAPEHEDSGVVCYSSVDVLPGGDELIWRYDALD